MVKPDKSTAAVSLAGGITLSLIRKHNPRFDPKTAICYAPMSDLNHKEGMGMLEGAGFLDF